MIDGYGFFPYDRYGITFVPQLFYKEIMLPVGVQATQIHLNYWNLKKLSEFELFLKNNRGKFLDFDQTISLTKNSKISFLLNKSLEIALKLKRII